MVAAHQTRNPQAEAQWALVERVLASQQFRRTVRLRDFLRFVADRSIHHPGTPVPEHEVGTAVFHRAANYDTGADNIVRVSAGDLRRRLEQYFLEEGAGEALVCEMPRGGYTLVFHPREADAVQAAETVPTVVASVAPPGNGPAFVADELREPVPSDALRHTFADRLAPVEGAPARSWFRDVRTLVLVTICLCLAALTGAMLLRHGREPWQQTAPLLAIWGDFLAPGSGTEVVLADSSYAVIRSLTHKAVSLQDYLNYRYRDAANDPTLDPSTRAAIATMLARNSGSIGDFEAARSILALTRQPAQVVMGSAHDFTPSVVKSNNVVLVGASASNPWVTLYRGQRTLAIEQDPVDNVAVVRNLQPGPGEQAEYRVATSSSDVSGYAVISILHNIDPGKRVMILEGTDSQATLAASNFVCSEAGAAQIESALHGRENAQQIDVLLRSSKLLATTLGASMVTVHAR
ncbi:hypothetical protein [Terriglobus aquaticus]|uniref:OmpR/PhoB-type domain-containing protein n=1 Tax=Terriglobus aquaticus TaxID=940139 RepID=A0ABW9KQS8_9BACT|nr:hypothetical protein [Terriglobus aquaticus]